MSLGQMSGQRRVSVDQFTGDLSSLFARHGIDPGSALAFAKFESRFALSDAFRSQLFTLCTAISHMFEVDLTGEQLLTLIARGLNSTEAFDGGAQLHERVRAEFLRGYDAWNRRDVSLVDVWPARGQSADPHAIPFPPPAAAFVEPAAADPHAIPLPPPAMAFVEPPAAAVRAPAPDSTQGPSARELRSDGSQTGGLDVEHLTLGELTRLLEKIEDRIRAMKQLIQLMADDAPVRGEESSDAAEQSDRPVRIDDDAFLARHAYLRPVRRASTSPQTIVSESKPILSAPIVRLATPELPRGAGPEHVTRRGGVRMVGIIVAAAVLMAAGIAGMFLYPSLHSTYFTQAAQPDLPMQKVSEISPLAADTAPAANSPDGTSRVAEILSHRALSPVEWNIQAAKPKSAAGE